MKRLGGGVLMMAGFVMMLSVIPSWGGPPNPTASDGNGNTAGGTGALQNLASGSGNTAFGVFALGSDTTGISNTASGHFALGTNTNGDGNTATGHSALVSNTSGSLNTASGLGALGDNTTGNNNTASGAFALLQNTTGDDNTATGFEALNSNKTGRFNTASGSKALYSNAAGGGHTATGANALFNNTTGSANTASGVQALENSHTGAKNVALGNQALQNSTGNQNIGIGQGAGAALTSGNKNIYLGHPGATSEANTMRLGNMQKKTYIAGVNTAAVTGSTVVIDAAGRLGTQLSSARYKRDIEPMAAESAGLLQLRPVTFSYTEDDQGTRQYGLVAEEVATIYPELVTRTADGQVQAVRYQELIPMLLNEVQRQHQAIERQAGELAELRKMVGRLTGAAAAQR